MNENLSFQWYMLVYPLAALAYFELLRRLDRYWARRTPWTDEEIMAQYARVNGISEYDVFHMAAPHWSVAGQQVEADFKTYLRDGVIPYYVRDFLRNVRKELFPDSEADRLNNPANPDSGE